MFRGHYAILCFMNKDFQQIAEKWQLQGNNFDMATLLDSVARQVYHFLLNDRAKLFTMLYLLDVDEHKLDEIFKHEAVLLPFKIAEEIIIRELRRINQKKHDS